jgi:hypothetical protein
LKTNNEKRLKGESIVKKFLTNDLPGDTQLINNSIVRRKLEKLSFGIAGLVSTYFSNQKNVVFAEPGFEAVRRRPVLEVDQRDEQHGLYGVFRGQRQPSQIHGGLHRNQELPDIYSETF